MIVLERPSTDQQFLKYLDQSHSRSLKLPFFLILMLFDPQQVPLTVSTCLNALTCCNSISKETLQRKQTGGKKSFLMCETFVNTETVQ